MKFEKKTPELNEIPSNILDLPILLRDEEASLFEELDRIRMEIFGPDRDVWFLDENWLRLECMSSSRDPDPVSRRIREIRDRVVEGCSRFTYYTVRKMGSAKTVPFVEQFQEGLLGVAEAIFRYDTRVAVRFQSYAGWIIRTYVRQYRLVNSDFMKTPSRVAEIRRFLYHYKGDVRTPEEIKREMDAKYAFTTPLVTIEHALQTYRASSEIVHGDSVSSIFEHVAVEFEDMEDRMADQIQISKIREFIHHLNPSQYRVISAKYGLEDGEERSNIQISEDMKLTRERVRQIEKGALEILRTMMARDMNRKRAVSYVTNLKDEHHDEFSRRHSDRTDRGGILGRRVPSLLGV